MSSQSIDAAIIGGGIAGAWALNLLHKRGYNVVLLEQDSLGCGQTLASQGMIHGGLKYALSGALTGASEAIADMPRRWRACLSGQDDVDLRGTNLLSEHYYMFAADTTYGRLTTFFASKALRGRIDKVKPKDWPQEFSGFDGVVYQLNDFVLDTEDLLAKLTEDLGDRVFKASAEPDTISQNPTGGYDIKLADTTLHAGQLICCAGNGSAALIDALGVPNINVQHRPLKQVVVKPKHDVLMYAHCLTALTSNEPRLTITSHQRQGETIWYLGGQLADKGVALSDDEQLQLAQRELAACVPWLDWQGASYETLTVQRAEPKQSGGLKPDEAYVQRQDNFIQCFPTKLTLAPDLGDKLLEVMDPPRWQGEVRSQQPRAQVGSAPW